MKVIIETVPHEQQRYNTCGDWYWGEDGTSQRVLYIKVSELEGLNRLQSIALLGIHELVEAIICQNRGISQDTVDDFDLKWQGKGEPGDAPNCPYGEAHRIATGVELTMAAMLDINWQQYSAEIEKLG